ncbi:MAG TPA: ATP-binding protein [Mycobacteriales bacterium]|nr:ATP-binding protein [Mycobacteriales bacterium]
MTGVGATPLGRVLPRRAASIVADALADTRVVLVTGARQCGKSTLVRVLAKDRSAEWRNLDSAVTRQAAASDPTGFVDFGELMVIDEIQRVPELLLAIKEQVDADPRPGRYLLTGSARVLGLRALPDTLPGRTETVELWPFSQGEIDGLQEGFVDAAFTDAGVLHHTSAVSRGEYAERIVRGGFPGAVARANPARRERFFDSYVADLVARDVSQLSEIERPAQLCALLRLLAARSGQLLVGNALSNDLQVSARTVHRYLSLLEEVFLIKRIPAWSRNVSSRAVGTPKVSFVDSGVAGNLLDADARSLLRPGGPFGPLLEGFVLTELARQLTWSRRRVELSHYRTKDGTEVDAVLEDRQGRVVGIEVKASSTVRSDDFRGLRHLADRLDEDFVAGFVLYTGTQTLPFGPRLRAVPVSALWEITGPCRHPPVPGEQNGWHGSLARPRG